MLKMVKLTNFARQTQILGHFSQTAAMHQKNCTLREAKAMQCSEYQIFILLTKIIHVSNHS